jgi:uncharacterized protein YyaL (SSP411 family)
VFCIADRSADLPGVLAQREAQGGEAAYLCQGTECLAPMSTPEEVEQHLSAK